MSNRRRNDFLIPTLGVLFDGIAIELAFLCSYWLRFNSDVLTFLTVSEDSPPLGAYVYGSLVVISVWWMLFNSRGMYGARRNVALSDEFVNVVKLVSVGMLLVMSAAFFYRAFSYSRIVFGLLWIFSSLFIFIGRVFLLQIEKSLYRKGRELRNAVIIGNNQTANRMYEVLHNHSLLGYKFIGYFAQSKCEGNEPLSQEHYLGTFDEVSDALNNRNIELVLVAMNLDEHDALYKLLRECEGINVEFMMVPDILELMAGGIRVKEIEGIPFIKIKGVPITTWGRIMKRAFDLVVGLGFVIAGSWLFGLIAMFIKITSKGPVFFKQERIGFDGEPFNMIKFRTMRVGAEKFDNQAGLGMKDDPRQTSIGTILRKTSLDELPQLLNVLSGEMSLVGPRPERTFYVEKFKNIIPKYLDRHRVKTGMTGWAQIHGFRGDTSLEERIRYDLYYIENWSLGLDVKILFKTVGTVIFHRD
ncbi:MAG: undecaprenyl-phosphate glucose phosphotransferase [Ignavibacteriae bacterium]|nr:undecaprenyl-phosphate glucose phosphotransferase [Ignavibacteriota bacterium]